MALLNCLRRQQNQASQSVGWDKRPQGLVARVKDFVLGPEYLLLWQPPEETVTKEAVPDPYEKEGATDTTAEKPKEGVRGDASIAQITVVCENEAAGSCNKDDVQAGKAYLCEPTTGNKHTEWRVPEDRKSTEWTKKDAPEHVVERRMSEFDQRMQVYDDVKKTSFLPFKPPPFFTNILSILGGTFKVFQYVVTVMVALMAMQHAVDRYWQLQGDTSLWQNLLFFIFISYPMITLLLVVLTNNEMAIRRFMYYRMMSLQVIIDWENKKMWDLWFFVYFVASFIILLCYGFWAGWLTQNDKTVSVWPQLSIVAMQSMLLFMFWMTAVNMEEQLVPLNRVIENETEAAKELIQRCTVVQEEHFKAAVMRSYTRKRAFKWLSLEEQRIEGNKMTQPGTRSKAAWFDLNRMREASDKKYIQPVCTVLERLGDRLYDIVWGKCYAVWFATSFWSVSLFRFGRCTDGRQHATMWPYPRDATYFRLLALLSGICAVLVFAVEAYAIWFVVFANNNAERDMYGLSECKMCYEHHKAAGETCKTMATTEACWAAAKRGFCSFEDILLNSLNLNGTEVLALDTAQCKKDSLLSWA